MSKGEDQFFVNELGYVRPITKEEYRKRLNVMGKKRDVVLIKPKKIGNISLQSEGVPSARG